jgi:16S rRNA (guanine(966)-N(2))-methyltransferase RsmD
VREALFGILGEVRGAVVLDLFAGTGGLGIEALSRGAERAVFVERDGGAVRALQANLATLELASAEAEVRQSDALAALRTARGRKETYDLVFIDPPYSQTHDLGAEISAVLPSVLSPAARVVVESDRRAPLQIALALERERRYGDTQITIHRHQ